MQIVKDQIFISSLQNILENIAEDSISQAIIFDNELEEKIDNLSYIPFYQDGFKEGAKEATFKNAIIMIEKFHISIDAIVKELNIKKEELLEYIKQKNLT